HLRVSTFFLSEKVRCISLISEWHGEFRKLHAFPTRRSSDLRRRARDPRPRARDVARRRVGGAHRRDPRRPRADRGARLHLSAAGDRKSTRLNSSHVKISYAVFCLKKKNKNVSPIP